MTGRGYKLLSVMLLFSIILGGSVWIFGKRGNVPPPEIDTIWRPVEALRNQIAKKELTLKEGEKQDVPFWDYRISISRLKDRETAVDVEQYRIRIRSAYQFAFSSDWKPSSWDIGLIAYQDDVGVRRAHVVTSKRGND